VLIGILQARNIGEKGLYADFAASCIFNTRLVKFRRFPAFNMLCFRIALLICFLSHGVLAQEPESAVPVAQEQSAENTSKSIKDYKDYTLIDLILAAGIIGHTIILLSVVAVALMIEHFITIREKVLIPPGFADEVAKQLNEGKWNDAAKLCREDPSVLGIVLTAGLKECEIGWNSIEKATEDALAEQAARLYRKTEYLNLIGNIAPMIGLLGTVVGLLIAFHDMAALEGYQQRAGDLAGGIYLALVTTVQGLLVAIPSLAAYAVFNNRIALLMAETTYIAEQILRPVKKRLLKSK